MRLAARRTVDPHRSIRAFRSVTSLRPFRTLRTLAPLRAIDAHLAVRPTMWPIRTPVMTPALTVPVAFPLDLLDIGVSGDDFLRGRQPDIGCRHPRNGHQGRYESELLHDSRPPYRLTR
jgi:hypothetical protein